MMPVYSMIPCVPQTCKIMIITNGLVIKWQQIYCRGYSALLMSIQLFSLFMASSKTVGSVSLEGSSLSFLLCNVMTFTWREERLVRIDYALGLIWPRYLVNKRWLPKQNLVRFTLFTLKGGRQVEPTVWPVTYCSMQTRCQVMTM